MLKKEDIIKIVDSMAGKYAAHEILQDWFKMYAIAISNFTDIIKNDISKKREMEYKTIAEKYNKTDFEKFGEIGAILVDCLNREPDDVLGHVYMLAAARSNNAGQFFTPFNISELVVGLSSSQIDISKPVIEVNEPSVGSGGMIIAMYKYIKMHGGNPQKQLRVIANDIDYRCVYMTYIQMSLLGIKGIVYQADTLSLGKVNPEQVFYTPGKRGLLI